MQNVTLVLLPGLDGTGLLFRPFLDILPIETKSLLISYPGDKALSYDALLVMVADRLQGLTDLVLIAETFSGPIALRYAAQHPHQVAAVILCASFVTSPLNTWLRYVISPLVFLIPRPRFLIRRMMVGPDAPDELVALVRDTTLRANPHVLAGRIRALLDLDCREVLQNALPPLFYLCAEHDRLVAKSHMSAICHLHPGIQTVMINGPHLLLQSRPQECWHEIERFLKEFVP